MRSPVLAFSDLLPANHMSSSAKAGAALRSCAKNTPTCGYCNTFDPCNNVPRIGRVLMARGRDAIDVALTTTFGPNALISFKVVTDEIINN